MVDSINPKIASPQAQLEKVRKELADRRELDAASEQAREGDRTAPEGPEVVKLSQSTSDGVGSSSSVNLTA